MKEIYSFTIKKETEVETKVETADGVLIKKKKAKVPVKVILKSPSRFEKELAYSFEATEWSKAVSSGLLTKQMLSRYYADNGGILSKDDLKYSNELVDSYNEKIREYQKLTVEKATDEALAPLKDEISDLYSKIQIIDNSREELFKNSAETRAKEKTVVWLVLYLTYLEENGKPVPFFGEGDYDAKLKKLYDFSEMEDSFINSVIEKASLYISFWYHGRLNDKEDFDFLNKELEKTSDESKG